MATPAITPDQDQQTAPPVAPVDNSAGPTLAQRIKGKFPGAYDDIPDADLETKILAKHPEYSDLPRTVSSKGPIPAGQPNAAGPAPMQEVSPGVGGLIKDEAKSAVQNPGQALSGAANEGLSLIQSAMPGAGDTQIDPKTGKPPVEDPNAPGMGIARAVRKYVHPPQTQAEQAGAHGMDVAAAVTNAPNAIKSAVSSTKALRDIPAALSSDTIDTLNSVAQKEGLPQLTAKTARDAAGEMSQNFVNRAKSNYRVVDEAVGGDLKPVQEKIQDLKTSIRTNRVLNPDLADKLTSQLADQQQRLTELIGEAKQNGVPNADTVMKAADADYSKGMAMKKVESGIKTASGMAKMDGHPHPGGFTSQVDRLERTGVLQRAVGQDATDQLIKNTQDALSRSKTVAKIGTVAKWGAGIAGTGVAGKLAVDALSGKH